MTSVNAPQNPRPPLSLSTPPHRYHWLRLRTSAWREEENISQLCALIFYFFIQQRQAQPLIQVHSLFSCRFSVQWWMGKAVCWGCIHCPAWSNNILADKPTANSSRHSVLGQGATDPGLLPMCQFHWWWIKQKTMGQNRKMTLTLITSNHYFQTGLSGIFFVWFMYEK